MKNGLTNELNDLDICLNRILRNPLSYENYEQFNQGYNVDLKPAIQSQVDLINGQISRLASTLK
jgi:hypothetical protein